MMSAGVKGQMEDSDKVELAGIGRHEEATGQLEWSVQVVMGDKWELQRLFYWVLEERSLIEGVLLVSVLSSSFFHYRNNGGRSEGCGNNRSGG